MQDQEERAGPALGEGLGEHPWETRIQEVLAHTGRFLASCPLLPPPPPGTSPGRLTRTPAEDLAFSHLLFQLCPWVSVLWTAEWMGPGEARQPQNRICSFGP